MHDDRRRAIGKLVSVAADKFVVEMHAGTDNFTVVGFDDIHYVARLGSFVVIPVQTNYVVAEVVGLRERDTSANRNDGDGLEKTSSAKFLDVVPLGTLPKNTKEDFRFGVSTFPSLYADTLYALDIELDRIFQTANAIEEVKGEEPNTALKALPIGSSVVFESYDVKVLVDEFFGGHAAILGNTGSGKSCTVATILQSLFEKPEEYRARGATFVVLDVNGEYTKAFEELKNHGIGVKTLVLDGMDSASSLRLPHWFLDVAEWELLLRASERTQVPVLRTALGLAGLISDNQVEARKIRKHILASCVLAAFSQAADGAAGRRQRILGLLHLHGCDSLDRNLLSKYGYDARFGNFSNDVNERNFLSEVENHLLTDVKIPPYTNQVFPFSLLEQAFELALLYEEAHGNNQIRDYCSQMLTRFQSLKSRPDYAFLRHEKTTCSSEDSESEYLRNLIGLNTDSGGQTKESQIVILDMNDVEDEVVELFSSVVCRMIFRLMRKANPRNEMPIHLVLEEAHRYIAEKPANFAIDASEIFERVAKEGRKYGLFLLVASQRPSELSKAVLSQCANFVVHRIQNPDDLTQIRQMTPFISDAVLKRLPSLPKQHALVFGNAVTIPTTFKVRQAKPKPHSDDSRIRRLWFHQKGQNIPITV